MQLIHTSPGKIEKIDEYGMFNDCLFFSLEPYYMTQARPVYTYSIEINEGKIISVGDLYDEEIISEIIEDLGEFALTEELDESLAEKLLDGSKLICDLAPHDTMDYTEYSEYEWEIQRKQARAAVNMGYEGCQGTDEQGTVYIIPMFGRESELKLKSID